MSLLRPLRSRYLHTLKPSISLSPHLYTTESTPAPTSNEDVIKTKKPLHLLFTEAVGLSPKHDYESDTEELNDLNKKLKKLEQQVRKLREDNLSSVAKIENLEKGNNLQVKKAEAGNKKQSQIKPKKPARLYSLFVNEDNKSTSIRDLEEDPKVYKRLSPEMETFATHLYEEGYFQDANFVSGDKFDMSCFENSYAREYIRSAAEQFGRDMQEIGQWVSTSDLKKVALFGCPSLGKKNILAAKKLRAFFKVHEPTVCSICPLKASCKFPDQGVWKFDTNNLNLAVVMRVITLYALESTHPQLTVPEEIKNAVSHLLKEIMNLSRTYK